MTNLVITTIEQGKQVASKEALLQTIKATLIGKRRVIRFITCEVDGSISKGQALVYLQRQTDDLVQLEFNVKNGLVCVYEAFFTCINIRECTGR